MFDKILIGIISKIIVGEGKAGVKRLFNKSPAQRAIKKTAEDFPYVAVVESALKVWSQSDDFSKQLEEVCAGRVLSDDTFIDSFINIGGFYSGIGDPTPMARRVLKAFAENLQKELYKDTEGLFLESQRAGVRHTAIQEELQKLGGQLNNLSLSLEQQNKLEDELLSQALCEYLTALRAYSNQLPYVALPGKPLPELSNIYIEQLTAEQASAEEAKTDNVGTIQQAIERHSHLLIKAGPGMGKSTLLNYLSLSLIDLWESNERTLLIPIKVSAKGIASHAMDLSSSLYVQVKEELGQYLHRALPENFFEKPPVPGATWLVMLDGLDEIVTPKIQEEFIRKIKHHLVSHRSLFRFIITTRPSSSSKLFPLSEFGHYEIRAMEGDQPEKFAKRWFRSRLEVLPGDAEQFLLQIKESRIDDLIRVPLLLTMSAAIYELNRDKPLPTRRAGLYNSFVTALLEEEESIRGTRKLFISLWENRYGLQGMACADKLFVGRRQMLEHIALWQQKGNEEPIIEEAIRYVRKQVGVGDSIDDEWLSVQVNILLQRSGLLFQRGREMVFIHDTFREFLAASAIANKYSSNHKRAESLAKLLGRDGWREVLLFLLGVWSEKGTDVSGIVRQIYKSPRYILAGIALAEGAQVSADLESKIITSLVNRARRVKDKSNSFETDTTSVSVLSRIRGRDQVRIGLLNLTREPDVDLYVALKAAESLASLGYTDALLVSAWDSAVDTWRRLHYAITLSDFGFGKGAAQVFLSLARSPSTSRDARARYMNDRVRYFGARHLYDLGYADEAGEILLSLALDKNVGEPTREEALESLFWFDRYSEFITLANEQKEDAPKHLHKAAAILLRLEQTGEARRILLTIINTANEAGIYSLNDAIRKLAEIGLDDESVSVLLRLAQNPGAESGVRVKAAQEIGKYGLVDEACEILLSLTQHYEQKQRGRLEAALALGLLGKIETASSILLSLTVDGQALLDTSFEIREHHLVKTSVPFDAIEALKEINQINVLNSIASDSNLLPAVREHAATVLGKAGFISNAADALISLLHKPHLDENVRDQVFRSLKRFGPKDKLFSFACNTSFALEDRIHAAEILNELSETEKAATVLHNIVFEPQNNSYTRWSAAEILRKIDPSIVSTPPFISLKNEIVALLLSVVFDDNVEKQKRMEVLGVLHHVGGDKELLNISQDRRVDEQIRTNAARGLRKTNMVGEAAKVLLDIIRNNAHKDEGWLMNALEFFRLINYDARDQGKPHRIDELLILGNEKSLDSWVRSYAAGILFNLGHYNEGSSICVDIVRTPKYQKTYSVTSAISQLQLHDCTNDLLHLAKDERVEIKLRIDIIKHFKDIRSRISLSATSELLKGIGELASSDPHKGIRRAAQDVVPSLRKFLQKKVRQKQDASMLDDLIQSL
jgi:thioredoxin-like negative regulator of GroEL/energy-coupling factor transporter ATP-binding protein EcfA2